MSRPGLPPAYHNPGGIRKASTNQQSRGNIRWIQEFPNQNRTSTRGESSARLVDEDSSETNNETKIYRITATGERQLRAPLLNAYLLADAPLRLSIGSARDPFSTLPVPWKPPYGIITSYCT